MGSTVKLSAAAQHLHVPRALYRQCGHSQTSHSRPRSPKLGPHAPLVPAQRAARVSNANAPMRV